MLPAAPTCPQYPFAPNDPGLACTLCFVPATGAGMGPLARAEFARVLDVTKRTASQAALALIDAGIATMRDTDSVLLATS